MHSNSEAPEENGGMTVGGVRGFPRKMACIWLNMKPLGTGLMPRSLPNPWRLRRPPP